MKLKNAVGKLYCHNEIVALWFETDQGFKTLMWRGEVWRIPEKFEKLRIARFFGTIPQSILEADTINILIKSKPIKVGCHTCIKWGRMDCPNSAECYCDPTKPHWEWNESMWNERAGKESK